MNDAVADETVAALARHVGPREVDMIAANEQRLLRHPEIIGAMYLNKKARMSTVDRVVELAVRNHIRVPGLAAWDEIARSLDGGTAAASSEADALFAYIADAMTGDDSALTTGDPDAVIDQPEPEVDLAPTEGVTISKL